MVLAPPRPSAKFGADPAPGGAPYALARPTVGDDLGDRQHHRHRGLHDARSADEAGTSSILVLGVIAVDAVLLGVMFGQLTKRIPTSDGGLYAYSRHEFGDFAGFLTACSASST